MNAVEKLKEIKTLLFGSQEKFLAVKLKDGTDAEVSALEVGGTVMVAGQPAPAGEHELEDGTVLVVAEGGVISEVKPVVPEDMNQAPAAPAPAPAPQNYDEQFNTINQKFSDYEQKFQSYENRFSTYDQAIGKLVGLVEELTKVPTADPAQTPNTFTSEKEQKRNEAIERIAASLKQIRNNKN